MTIEAVMAPWVIEGIFPYHDADGVHVYDIVRFAAPPVTRVDDPRIPVRDGRHRCGICEAVFRLSGTTPFKSTLLILGASALGAPFKSGTMWPTLGTSIPLVANGTGQLTLSTTWPVTIPSGFSLWAQFWHPDTGAVYGFAGSNGVRGTTP